MEFQYIPSFTITKSLLDMTPYLPSNFLSKYPEWIQKQINLQGGIYGVPWDSGPLRLHLPQGPARQGRRQDADQHLGRVRHRRGQVPQGQPELLPGQHARWADRASGSGCSGRTARSRSRRTRTTSRSTSPTRRTSRSPTTGTSSTRTAPSRTTPDFTSAWYRASRRASTRAGSRRPGGRSSSSPTPTNSKGQWRAQALPQWNAGDQVSGNWGGSTLAVLKDSQEPGRGDRVRALDPPGAAAGGDVLVRALPVPDADLDAHEPDSG